MDASVVRATASGGRERQLANRLVSLHRRAMRGRGGENERREICVRCGKQEIEWRGKTPVHSTTLSTAYACGCQGTQTDTRHCLTLRVLLSGTEIVRPGSESNKTNSNSFGPV